MFLPGEYAASLERRPTVWKKTTTKTKTTGRRRKKQEIGKKSDDEREDEEKEKERRVGGGGRWYAVFALDVVGIVLTSLQPRFDQSKEESRTTRVESMAR